MTEETKNKIIAAIKLSMSNREACILAGINEDTFYSWLKENSEFSESINKARLAGKAALVNMVYKAGEKNWKSAAWLLSKRYPQEFGDNERKETDSFDRIAEFIHEFRIKE